MPKPPDMAASHCRTTLSKHALWYLDAVKSEYTSIRYSLDMSVSGHESHEKALQQIDALIEKDESLTWAELFTFEKLVLQLQPEHRLRTKLVALRESYRQMVGVRAYSKYLGACDPKSFEVEAMAPTGMRGLLLQETENVLSEIHWHYSVTLARQESLEELQWALLYRFVWIPILGAMLAALMYASSRSVGTYLIVLLAGTTGSFASIQRRIQHSKHRPGYYDPITRLFALDHERLSLYLSLASGAVFATVLYLLFIGGLLSGGALFPSISAPTGFTTGSAFRDFCMKTDPATGADFAKLLVWSFLAGFAERFVPDVLDRLTRAGTQEDAPSTADGRASRQEPDAGETKASDRRSGTHHGTR